MFAAATAHTAHQHAYADKTYIQTQGALHSAQRYLCLDYHSMRLRLCACDAAGANSQWQKEQLLSGTPKPVAVTGWPSVRQPIYGQLQPLTSL